MIDIKQFRITAATRCPEEYPSIDKEVMIKEHLCRMIVEYVEKQQKFKVELVDTILSEYRLSLYILTEEELLFLLKEVERRTRQAESVQRYMEVRDK
jgi:hypothetical protein